MNCIHVNEKINLLRDEMKKRKIDYYIVDTSDFHQTENIGDHFKAREFLSGFTGSAGTLLVSLSEARLWVDGRYFLQAKKELADTEILRMEMGKEQVPSLERYLETAVDEGESIGFFESVTSLSAFEELLKIAKAKNICLKTEYDLVDVIWKKRPKIKSEKAWLLNLEEAGEERRDKIAKLQNYLKEEKIDGHLISSLDDVAWIFNMRGDDIEYMPVAMAYAYISQRESYLFIDREKLSCRDVNMLEKDGIYILPYDDIYGFFNDLNICKLSVDKETLNIRVFKGIPKHIKVIAGENKLRKWKACKNETELDNIRKIHMRDAVAVTKFLFWLDTNIQKENIDECRASKKLLDFRREQEGFIQPSFETICGYGANGAIVHYQPKRENCSFIMKKGLLLIDSGAHYNGGTTDVTRTIAMGELSESEKRDFTIVVRAMIRLGKAKFLQGCSGKNLDILARGVIWEALQDYRHGTGHGVGYMLNVHEGPIGIRWRGDSESEEILSHGMTITNEPGIYVEGKYGIRIENEMIVLESQKNEYGQFMEFEHVTLIPIDKRGILPHKMNKDEIKWLNDYHALVYSSLEKYMSHDERKWLKMMTSPIDM